MRTLFLVREDKLTVWMMDGNALYYVTKKFADVNCVIQQAESPNTPQWCGGGSQLWGT